MATVFKETCETGEFAVFSGGTDTRAAFNVWHADNLDEKSQVPLGKIGAYDPVVDLKQANGTVAYKEKTLSSAIDNGQTAWIGFPKLWFFDHVSDVREWKSGDAVTVVELHDSAGAQWSIQIAKADEIGAFRVGLMTDAETEMNPATSVVVELEEPDMKDEWSVETDELFCALRFTVDTAGNTSTAQLYSGRDAVGKATTHTSAIASGGITKIRWGSCQATNVKVGYIQFGDMEHRSGDDQIFPPYDRTDDLLIQVVTETQCLTPGPGQLLEAVRWAESSAGSTVVFYDADRYEYVGEQDRIIGHVDSDAKVMTYSPTFDHGLYAVVSGTPKATVVWKEGDEDDEDDEDEDEDDQLVEGL